MTKSCPRRDQLAHFCPMKITREVRDCTDARGVERARGLNAGMTGKSAQFREQGIEL